jgi:LEA14-like dessication related protein
MKNIKHKMWPIIFLIIVVISLISCSSLDSIIGKAGIQKPDVSVTHAKIDKLSFTSADLLFDLKITNPNQVGLKFTGFDYNFLIEGTSFLSGVQESGIEIHSKSDSTVQLPLTLVYKNVYETFRNLYEKDSSNYQLKCSFSFNVPVLGNVTVPVNKEGELPLLKLPSINLKSLRIARLGFSRADLGLDILLKNPNAFSIDINKFHYQFLVNEENWFSGETEQQIKVNEKEENLIQIPVSINFIEVGRSIYTTLQQEENLNYRLKGNIVLLPTLPLIGEVQLTFDETGRIRIIR